MDYRHLSQIMVLKKLLHGLQQRLPFGGIRRLTPCDHIQSVLSRLQGRERDLELKLAQENLPAKRRRLELKLEVIRIQQTKGRARQFELRDGCK